MGPLGTQEMIFIFILALMLFGPKKLPELGRTVGKAITEFRRASAELKSTLDREMQQLEQETQAIHQEVVSQYESVSTSYDYSAYENGYETSSSYPSTESAPALEGAQSPATALPEGTAAPGEAPVTVAQHESIPPQVAEPASSASAAPEAAEKHA
jgi:TatA/E family protein of Tat protein translocase